MAQRHSNWSVSSDQYIHPPTVDREGKKKDKEQIHHYYLSCEQIQKSDSDVVKDGQPLLGPLCLFFPLLTLHLGPHRKHVPTLPAIDKTCCIDHSFMQSYLNYLLDWPHTDEQMQSHTNNTSVMLTEPLISLSFLLVPSVCPSYVLHQQTDTTSPSHSFSVFCCSCFPSEI